HLRFAPRLLLHSNKLGNQTHEIKSFECGAFLRSLNLLLQTRRHGNVHKQLGDRARFRRGSIAVLPFRNVFRDHNRILANSAKTAGEVFWSVVVHSDFTLYLVSGNFSKRASRFPKFHRESTAAGWRDSARWLVANRGIG